MGTAPAAAVRAVEGHEPHDLQQRLRGLLERSAPGDGHALAERLLPASVSGGDPRLPPQQGFYWLQVARWLARSFHLSRRATGRDLLADLLWIQYCVYCVFRVQDDLVDGDATDARLAVQSNHLLVEASRAAARHFDGGSPFWAVYRETIDATSRAIVALDRLQRTPERPSHAELGLYAELAACLKIAAAGVAIAAGRDGDWRQRISPALDRMAVAAQIVDDLHDLRDDLARGRINYAAWYLARPVFGTTAEAIEAVVASNVVGGKRLAELLAVATGLLDEAADLLPPSLCPRCHACLREYRDGLSALGEHTHHSRRAILGGPRGS